MKNMSMIIRTKFVQLYLQYCWLKPHTTYKTPERILTSMIVRSVLSIYSPTGKEGGQDILSGNWLRMLGSLIHATYILLYIVELWVVYSHFRVHWLVSWLQGHAHHREAEPSRDDGDGKFISSLLLSIGPSLPFFFFSFSHLFELSLTEVSSPLILYLSLPPLSLSLSHSFMYHLRKGDTKQTG